MGREVIEIGYLDDKEYAAMGFRSGLEIHQQLDTRQKLFCNCPVGLTNSEPDMRILRHMRPTLSELGEYDGTALMEFKTRKDVVYELFSDRTCTYEMDDTPPFPLNRQALEIAVEIALLLNCRIVDEVHVTRKQYLDGSIPTGFQRTAVVGVEGWIPYHGRRIRIAMLTLEEDACREVSDIGHTITFKTDRLSTPLVEIITYPDIRSPLEAEEVNWMLGDLMRATGKVRRGIGTVRQDVNVSIDGGDRVEIKGVPRIGYHRALTHVEALRQKALIKLKAEFINRGIDAGSLKTEHAKVNDILRQTRSPAIKEALEAGGDVIAVLLRDCAGLFNYPTQPDRIFADEVAGRIRVVACIDKMPNLVHSDGVQKSGLKDREWLELRNSIGAEERDLIALVFGDPRDALTAAGEVEIRVREALEGVPRETRQAFPDGRTDFERILPGPDRMYPDTDTPPTPVARELVDRISSALPELPWDREDRYLRLGLNAERAHELSRSECSMIFNAIVGSTNLSVRFVADTILQLTKYLARQGINHEQLGIEAWREAFELLEQNVVCKEKLVDLLEGMAQQPGRSAIDIAGENGFGCLKVEEVDEACDEVIKKWQPETDISRAKGTRYLVGQVMRQIGKRYPGKAVKAKIVERLKAMGAENG